MEKEEEEEQKIGVLKKEGTSDDEVYKEVRHKKSQAGNERSGK